MDKILDSSRMDKGAFQIAPLGDEKDDLSYWHSRSPAERLLALEHMRQAIYGYDPATTRLQRLLEITQLT